MPVIDRRRISKRPSVPIFTNARIAEIEVRALKNLAAIQVVTAALQGVSPRRLRVAKVSNGHD